MFKKILIANRGEITARIIRAAKHLNIETVAVYSAIEKDAFFLREADETVCLGPAPAIESYLNIEKILAVARATKADAIHPGYGFLAENAEFAKACETQGIVFIGPTSSVIQAMGNKTYAKKLMEQLNIPVVASFQSEHKDLSIWKNAAQKIGFPVIIKAAAGGGGKGMRVVHDLAELENSLKSARREAFAAFNDETIFLEKYLSNVRHVELQILADSYGKVLQLLDRDCSVQRRHQKLIEEAPAPFLTASLKKAMADAAVKIAQAAQYTNAGTIEFLIDDQNNFYFMEMNTRLQVEHPITEMVTGIDIVQWQIRIAAKEPLSLEQKDIQPKGHAFEARIYAENPENDFKPSTGKLEVFRLPTPSSHLRIDTGFREHDRVSIYYDSLLAKIIVCANDRPTALNDLKNYLQQIFIMGVPTNIALLYQIIDHPMFQQGKFNTHFLNKYPEVFPAANQPAKEIIESAAYCFLQEMKKDEKSNSPWKLKDFWRINPNTPLMINFWFKDQPITIDHTQVKKPAAHIHCIFHNHSIHVFLQGLHYEFSLKKPLQTTISDQTTESHVTAPMPGKVVDIFVKPQQQINKGDKLLILEAMKMEHIITAPYNATIKSIHFQIGDTILEGAALVELEIQ